MIIGAPRWSLKLTHEPTGLSVDVNSNYFKTQQEAKTAGLKLLKAKINFWMMEPCTSGDILISSYVLPDNICWPEDLQNYKESK